MLSFQVSICIVRKLNNIYLMSGKNFDLLILCFQCINESYFINLKVIAKISAIINIIINHFSITDHFSLQYILLTGITITYGKHYGEFLSWSSNLGFFFLCFTDFLLQHRQSLLFCSPLLFIKMLLTLLNQLIFQFASFLHLKWNKQHASSNWPNLVRN